MNQLPVGCRGGDITEAGMSLSHRSPKEEARALVITVSHRPLEEWREQGLGSHIHSGLNPGFPCSLSHVILCLHEP